MINQEIEDNSVYFTIMPSNAGFTDQLFQFSVFYKLGLSLKFIYLHSDFINKREGSEDIYNFLGLNEYFYPNKLTSKTKLYRIMGTNNYFCRKVRLSRINRIKRIVKKAQFWVFNKLFFNDYNFVDIGLDDETPYEKDFVPIKDFQDLIRKIVSQKFKTRSNRKNVIRFYLVAGRYFFLKLAPSVNQQIPFFQDKFDLRSICLDRAKDRNIASGFSKNKIKVLVHIRLGDTATIETPWNSFIPLWSGNSFSQLKEYPDKSSEVFQRVMDVCDFSLFLKKFYTLIHPDNFSIVIFSDGYKTAFKEVFRMHDDLHLDNDKIAALKKSALTYEEERFSIFDDVKNQVRIVGENNEDLNKMVYSSLISDVIVIGCNQKMIPKLLATYSDVNSAHPPIIIALYISKLPDYKILLDETKAMVYPVNITDLEHDEGLFNALEELKRRHKELY